MPETSTSDSLRLHNVQIDDLLTMGNDASIDFDKHSSSPSAPAAGWVRLYAKSDGRLYLKDDAGTEVALDPETGGAVLKSLFDANTILAADTDDTPQAVPVAAGRLIGRKDSGGITALDAADILGILASAITFPLYASKWYDGTFPGGITRLSTVDLTLAADRLYAVPFWTPWETTWDQIGINVSTADTGKKIKLGIYEVGTDGYPGARVYGSAELSLDNTGAVTESGIAQALTPGLHFLAARSDSSAAQVTQQRRDNVGRLFPVDQPDEAGLSYCYSDSGTYASDGLPATFPSSLTVVTSSVMLRPMLKTSANP